MSGNFLDDTFYNYRSVLDGLTLVPPQRNLSFRGFTITDDPVNKRTIVEGGSASPLSVIWQPGGTASGNVYVDFAAACAACRDV